MEGLQCSCSKPSSFFFFSVLFLASAALSNANIADFDEHWRKKAEEARAQALAAYKPDPESVTNSFNQAVHKTLAATNSTRRSLRRQYNGPCMATNPIDRCWRCRSNWANHRKLLAQCAKGFGYGAMGGFAGRFYTVTDPSDSDVLNPRPGTLRHAVIQPEPLWIVFANDMIITLSQELIVSSNKTLDGRGANVHIAYGAQITLQFVRNVIIHNLHIHDLKSAAGGLVRDSTEHYGWRTRSDGDGISIYGSSNIWIDHVSMSNCEDGLIDAIEGSTAITISNSHFTRHNDVMLFGASDSNQADAIMQITVAFNHFGRGLVQRMPRCRWGFVHVVNNDYTHWLMYAVGGSKHPTIISQGNRYIAPPNLAAKEITKRDYATEAEWKQWVWKSDGDLMQNGAFFVQSGGQNMRKFSRTEFIKAKPGTFVTRLTRFSGALNCRVGQKC
ncbi:Pectate lyase [Ananas comosus]|uniref:Pectate lyase n=1 Tax=Ananas comosus TaxID=4615 RepID=A0A199UX05_ANACO|nr:Pectate lyase [Ananas comosus]